MLTFSDINKNLEKECASIHYVEQSYVLEKYTEENLKKLDLLLVGNNV